MVEKNGTAGAQAGRRVTLRDVARVAGVSHQTVSRAINGKGEIDPETQRRVLDVARELRYRPSRFGRGLVRPDVVTIGLIVSDVVNPFFPEFIAGVIEAAGGRNWQVVVASTENDRLRELTLLKSLGQQVDALVGYLSHTDEELEPYVAGVPLVIVDRGVGSAAHALVQVDTKAGVRAGLEHLIERGHRRIGMIDCVSTCDPMVRRQTFLDVAHAHRLPVDEGRIVLGEQSIAGGGDAFEMLRTAHPDVTAVLAFNDLVAIGAFQAARRLGVTVPAECALVGFDGLSIGELIDPPLTTIHLDKRRLGELAVHQVDQLLAGELPPPALLSPHLVVRGTT
ncbi:sugar-binding transcriptional regulator [Micromonospora sp. ATCC 39149]|uniref:LacI family DNA-binding transcriptional regulator n=1 Tax=Micromonospora carbonacea TaxID=47853 RepID=A0A7D5Y8E1_9ACTN|nr:LacI family DNA-binding transcriptional regulator [Micromonospora sp. ATCC 39149]EEP72214.1 sugar-binding transcriptional regulator [Micromonospora sp. ATCC 39149]QLJ98399.1 LacI family DNA-binding transcriptional regulator [Micromonospora carbonacea]